MSDDLTDITQIYYRVHNYETIKLLVTYSNKKHYRVPNHYTDISSNEPTIAEFKYYWVDYLCKKF